jgi:hypothetical protein
VIVAHIQDAPPPLESLRPDVPPGLAALVARLLAKDPADRPQTPREVAEALLPFAKPGSKPASKAATLPPAPAPVAAPADGDPFAGLGAAPTWTGARPAPGRYRLLLPAAVAAGVLLLGAVAGIVLTLKTPDGIVTLQVDPPDAEVAVVEGTITVKRKGDAEPYTITVTRGGVSCGSAGPGSMSKAGK